MLQKITICAVLVFALLFSSCGPSKKLKASRADNEELKTANSQLDSKNNDLQKQVNDLQKQVSDLTATNQSAAAQFQQYQAQCEKTKKDYQALQAAVNEILNNLEQVQKTIEAGMADFAGKGVNVYQKDGLVYVDMEDKLLYKSGSSVLGADGKKALGALSSALNDYPKLKVIVVGNTDDKQFKSGSDNWSLSTERANSVVRGLRDAYKVDPTRLTAAGRSRYDPVADNSTEEGRAKNRRTEIILNPDLERIWESVQTK